MPRMQAGCRSKKPQIPKSAGSGCRDWRSQPECLLYSWCLRSSVPPRRAIDRHPGIRLPPTPRPIRKLTIPGLGSRPPKQARTEPPLAPSFRSAAERLYMGQSPCNGASDGRECAPFRAAQRSAREELGMIGLVLVTHGRLAIEFRSPMEHVVAPPRQVERVTIDPDDEVEQWRKNILQAVTRVESGEGVA